MVQKIVANDDVYLEGVHFIIEKDGKKIWKVSFKLLIDDISAKQRMSQMRWSSRSNRKFSVTAQNTKRIAKPSGTFLPQQFIKPVCLKPFEIRYNFCSIHPFCSHWPKYFGIASNAYR